MAILKYKFKLFRDPECKVSNPNLCRDLLFAEPWYIALNVGQQPWCVGRL